MGTCIALEEKVRRKCGSRYRSVGKDSSPEVESSTRSIGLRSMSDSLRYSDTPASPFAGGGVPAIERLSSAQQAELFDETFVDAEVLPEEEEEEEEGNDALALNVLGLL